MAIRKQVSEWLGNYKSIVVWGASGLGRMAMQRWLPNDKIAYLVDTNEVRHGSTIADKPVKSIAAIGEEPPDCVMICSTAYIEIRGQLRELGFDGPAPFIYALKAIFTPSRVYRVEARNAR